MIQAEKRAGGETLERSRAWPRHCRALAGLDTACAGKRQEPVKADFGQITKAFLALLRSLALLYRQQSALKEC